MKHIILSLVTVTAFLCISCEGIYDNIKDFATEEIVYPAKFDVAYGRVGFERAEIDLTWPWIGRIPSGEMNMGKAKKTVIEYDNEVITIDSLCSWVNIKDLTQSKLYRFTIYSMDEFGDKSVPQEITLIPYTAMDLELLTISEPKVTYSSSVAIIDWPAGISSVVMEFYGLTYAYTDKDGIRREGERGEDPRFLIGNLETGQQVKIDIIYKLVPKIDESPILDTIYYERPLVLNVPASSTPIIPVNTATIFGNGIAVDWLIPSGSWVKFSYMNTNGNQVSNTVKSDTADYLLDYKSDLTYSVLYLPDPGSVDTFRTEPAPLTMNTDKRTFLTKGLPATVKACDFDLGGDGVGFHDSDATNSAGNYGYRENLGDYNSRGIDVESNLSIGYTNKDEWLMYTIDVQDEGYYNIDFHLSVNGDNVKCHIIVDDVASVTYPLTNNESWNAWRYHFASEQLTPPVYYFREGKHKVKFYFDSGGFNFNGLKFTWQDTP